MRKSFLNKLYLLPLSLFIGACGGGGESIDPAKPVTTATKISLTQKNFSKFAEVTNQFIESSLLSFHQIAINRYGYSLPTFTSQNDTATLNCDISGTKKQTISRQGGKIVRSFKNCKQDDYTLNGTLSYEYININASSNSYTFLLKLNNFTTTKNGYTEVTNGSFKTDVQLNGSNTSLVSTINHTIEYPDQNKSYKATNFVFSGIETIENISGNILIKSLGSISLESDRVNHRIKLVGNDSNIGYIQYKGSRYEKSFISSDSNIEIIGAELDRHDILDPDVLVDGENRAPEIISISDKSTHQNIPLTFNLKNFASDKNHDSLKFDLKVSNADSSNYSLIKKGFSEFTFNSNTPDTYNMTLTVTDPYGLSATQLFSIGVINMDIDGDGKNNDIDDDDDGDGILDIYDAFPLDKDESIDSDHDGIGNNTDPDDDNDGVNDDIDAFPLNSDESIDTDNDGIGNNSDWDDDGDGVSDTNDAFPLDKNESKDLDGDGIGDNADKDNDNDGVEDTLDLFVFDSRCSSHENGEVCYLKNAVASTQITTSSEGIVYFLIADEKLIYRWNSATKSFLTAIPLGSITSSDHLVTKMTYSNNHNRLYIGYDSGVVSFIDLITNIEHNFTTVPKSVQGLASIGKYLLVQDSSGAWATHYYYNENGVLTDSNEWNYYSTVYAWNATLNRVYFFRDDSSPNDILYEEIDPLTGKRVSENESPYHGAYSIKAPIVINETSGLIVIGSGSIFNATDLTWAGAVPSGIIDANWVNSTGLIAIRESNGSTILERRDNSTLQVLEEININGSPLKILTTNNGYFILSKQNDSLLITPYAPSNDSDGDGSLNANDSFPLDKAASVDSDNDGYPDYWNVGLTKNDSTTGLTLDSYPQDSACYLPEHGDGTTCDVTSTLPNYTPDKTIMGTDGIIYLFSKENNKVFRWSTPLADDLSPIIVGNNGTFNSTSPDVMAYSENHNRLYFGYANGDVTYISLNNSQLKEQDFATVAMSVRGLASAGEYVLIQDSSGAWNTHYFYDINGVLTDSNEWNQFSRVYAWNATLNRIYFFSDDTSPNDVYYEEINPLTGKRVSSGESPYHGDYSISPPLLISPDDSQVLIGSGTIFNATSLNWDSSVSNTFEKGLWAKNGKIITLRTVINNTRLDLYDSNKSWVLEKDFIGTPVGIFEYQNKYYVAINNSGTIEFSEFTP